MNKSDDRPLTGDVAVVTGSSRGIGRAIAIQLARAGASVAVNYLNSLEDAEETAREVEAHSAAFVVQSDVSNAQAVTEMSESVLAQFGRVDILVNNAGQIARPAMWDSSDQNAWRRNMEVNLAGAFNCVREFSGSLVASGNGRIVNISSVYGMIGAGAVASYTAAKAGLINYTLSLAKELAPSVRVNAIAAGNIDTAMTRNAGDDVVAWAIENTPLRRLGTPEDVASAVVYLVSPSASFVTGHVLVVDGGFVLK